MLGENLSSTEVEYLQHVLDDAKRIMHLTDGDGLRALSLLATPGGVIEKVHDLIFVKNWTSIPEPFTKSPPTNNAP